MASDDVDRYDFFLSRRGSVAAVSREVADVLTERGYKVFVQDYDVAINESVTAKMHAGIKNSRDLIVLYTSDYEQSEYTRRELSSFEALRLRDPKERHVVIFRCEDVQPEGLLADTAYQNLFDTNDLEERKRRIIAGAEGQAQGSLPPPLPFVGVPPRIASFTGRDDELDKLHASLMNDKHAAVTQSVGRASVQGLGGVGKTSLAVEYAYRYRKLYAGVWWCPAETRESLLTSLSELATKLGVTRRPEATTEEVAKTTLHRLAERRALWLLVYDNVTRPDEVIDLLPSGGARVLITSRFSDWKQLADEIVLDVMPVDEAMTLLQSRAGRRDPDGARMLATALGYLPLALDHAAAYCRRTQMSFADYARRATDLIEIAPRGAGYPRSVAATFDLAINEAVARCPAVEPLMGILGYCAPARIPMHVVAGDPTDGETLAAIAELAELSLIKHDPYNDGAPAVAVHRLVQAVARQRTKTTGTAANCMERLGERLNLPSPVNPRPGLRALRQLTGVFRILQHQRQLYSHEANRVDEFAARAQAMGDAQRAAKLHRIAGALRRAAEAGVKRPPQDSTPGSST